MTRIHIGNDFSEDIRPDRGWTGWWVQRLIWFVEPGDIVVLPTPPDMDFFAYVAEAKDFDLESINVVVLNRNDRDQMLNAATLADEELRSQIREAIGDREVIEILPLWPDNAISSLAEDLGLAHLLPGHSFMSQQGGIMVNSKAAFRTIAAGAGLPLPSGTVCMSQQGAITAAKSLLKSHDIVVVKHEWMSGGRGNEILTTRTDVRPIGARRSVTVSSDADIEKYFAQQWPWLSSEGRGRPIIEHYFEDSTAYFAEFLIDEHGSTFRGEGELLSAPYAVGQIMPGHFPSNSVREEFINHGMVLSETLRVIGYRGNLGPDAILTPEHELFFTEWNGRVTGSTHIYDEIGRHIIGDGFGTDRMILERVWPRGWAVGSFSEARDRLRDSGFAFDPATRTGVIFTNAHDGQSGVMYCIAAPDVERAWDIDRQLAEVFRSSGRLLEVRSDRFVEK